MLMTADGVDPLRKIEGIINQYTYKDISKEHLPNCMQDMPFNVERNRFQTWSGPETYSEKRN